MSVGTVSGGENRADGPHVRLDVLGPLRAQALDPATTSELAHTLQLGGSKPKLLIALLSVAGEGGIRDDRLIEAIWPDDELGDRVSSLRAYVSRLRAELRPHGADLVRVADGYALDLGPGSTDADDFEAVAGRAAQLLASDPRRAVTLATEALALWRGRAFAGFDDAVLLVAATARLDELRAQCVEDRIDGLLRLADTDTALVDARAHVVEHPYRERPALQLARGLYRSGRPREALSALADVTARLRNDLGLEPSREITELERAILDHDPRLETPRLPAAPASTSERTTSESRVELAAAAPRPDVVVGRRTEIARLTGTVAERRSALLVGLAGSGKSTLIRQIDGAVVGRCHEHPDAPPTWPWSDILQQLSRRCPHSDAVAHAHALVDGTEATTVFATAIAVAEAVEDVASTVPAIVIEDLHWASAPARQLTSFVLREIAGLAAAQRVAIIGTTRPTPDLGDPGGQETSSTTLSTGSFESTVHVGALDRDAISTILHTRLTRPPATPVVDDVVRETGGLALLVRRAAEELGAGRSVRLPERDSLVSTWLDTAADDDLTIARRAAIVGAQFTTELVAVACSDIDVGGTSGVRAALDRLALVGLVERDGDESWHFSHALLITALVDSTDDAVRASVNLVLANRLREENDPNRHRDAIVHHFAEAGDAADPAVVLDVAVAAARSARRSGAHSAAARHLATALAASERLGQARDARFELVMSAGEATWAAGDAATSRTYFGQAAELIDADDPRLADVAAGYAGFGMTHVEIDAAGRSMLERSAALSADTGVDPGAQLRCRTRLIIAEWDPGTIHHEAAAAIAEARALGDRRALAWALGAQLVSSMTMTLVDRRLTAAEEMLELGRELGDDGAVGLGLAHRSDARAELGFLDEAAADVKRLGQLASATGQPAHQWYAAHYLGALRCAQGRLDEGEALINEAFGVGQLSQGVAAIEAYSGALFMARASAGRELELLPLLEAGDNPAGDNRPTGIDPWLLGRATVLVAAGRIDEAAPVLTQVAATATRVPLDRVSSISLAQMLLVAHQIGDVDATRIAYELLEPYAHHCCGAASMILVGSAEAFLGLGALTLGNVDEAVDRIRIGVANNDRWGLHGWSSQGRTWLAAAEAAAGATSSVRNEPLSER